MAVAAKIDKIGMKRVKNQCKNQNKVAETIDHDSIDVSIIDVIQGL